MPLGLLWWLLVVRLCISCSGRLTGNGSVVVGEESVDIPLLRRWSGVCICCRRVVVIYLCKYVLLIR